MFASGSNASLFGFGSSNLECGGVPRVASLDMLRNMVDQDEKNRSIKRSEGAVQFTGAPEQAGPAQSPTSLRQQPGANAQLFQPSGPTVPHPAQSLAQSTSLLHLAAASLWFSGSCRIRRNCARGKCSLASNSRHECCAGAPMPGPSVAALPVGSAAAMGGMLQVPPHMLAYQNLPQSPQLLPVQGVQHGLQAPPGSVKASGMHSDGGGGPEEHDKMEQRRARRCV